MQFEFYLPTKIIFGEGLAKTAGQIIKKYGSRPLVITGRTAMLKYGHLEKVINSLELENLEVNVFNSISPNPGVDEVQGAVNLALQHRADVVVGLGGGSAIDAAKAVSVGVNYHSIDKIIGESIPEQEHLPVIAIPTTSGSGAEVTKGAILTDPQRQIKSGIRGEVLFPKVAIVDPELTYTMPRKITAETGFDALTHAIDSYIAKKASPLTDTYAVRAMKLIRDNLPLVLGDLENKDARANMSLAALLGGINVANASTCLPHRLQQALGSVVDISHGAGLAAVYPSWIKHSYPHSQAKFTIVADIFGSNNPEQAARAFMEKTGTSYKLSELGVKREHLEQALAKLSGNLENDPNPNVGPDLAKTIYEESF